VVKNSVQAYQYRTLTADVSDSRRPHNRQRNVYFRSVSVAFSPATLISDDDDRSG
jgi:hypothetical protein